MLTIKRDREGDDGWKGVGNDRDQGDGFVDRRKLGRDKAKRPDRKGKTLERRKPAAEAEWMPAPGHAAGRPAPGGTEHPSAAAGA